MLSEKARYYLVPASFAVVLIFVATFGAYSGTRRAERDATDHQTENHASEHPPEGEATDIPNILNFVLAAGTVVLAFSTICLVRDARETSRRDLRAYVFVENAIRHSRKNHPWEIRLAIRNYGKTPAYGVNVKLQKVIMPREWEPTFNLPLEMIGGAAIALPPRQNVVLNISFGDLDIGWDKFKAGETAALLYGRIDFTDAFGYSRWVTFRMRQTGDGILNFSYCETGNDTSESAGLSEPS